MADRVYSAEERRQLKWWTEFCYLDIGNLSAKQVHLTGVEIVDALNGAGEWADDTLFVSLAFTRDQLCAIQSLLRGVLEAAVGRQRVSGPEALRMPAKLVVEHEVLVRDGVLMLRPPAEPGPEAVLAYFLSRFGPIPVDIFVSCEVCGRTVFPLRTGLRTPRYCSSECRWRGWKQQENPGRKSYSAKRKPKPKQGKE